MIDEIFHIQQHAGFELKMWRCSSHRVLSSSQGVGESTKPFSANCDKVLGVMWNCDDDTLRFATKNVLAIRDVQPLTRRRILSGTMSLFAAPADLAAPVQTRKRVASGMGTTG